jgi:hypothetical protein
MNDNDFSVIKERYERVLWTYKTHEKAAERECRIAWWLQLIEKVLLAFSLVFVLRADTVLGSFLLFMSLCISLYNFGNDHLEQSRCHSTSGKKFLAIKDDYISLLSDMQNGCLNRKEFTARRDDLQRQFITQCEYVPQTCSDDYKNASKGLNEGKEGPSTEEEIDRFLPEALRKKL